MHLVLDVDFLLNLLSYGIPRNLGIVALAAAACTFRNFRICFFKAPFWFKKASKMGQKTKQNAPKRHMWVTLNDFGLTLEPLCGHLLTFVGPSWAYKQLIHTFTSVLKPGGGEGKCKVGTGRPRGGHKEATRRQCPPGWPSLTT